MPKFFPGQPVRLAISNTSQGVTGRFIKYREPEDYIGTSDPVTHKELDCLVKWDRTILNTHNEWSNSTIVDSGRLEAVIPAGYAVVSWGSCLWRPEHENDSAD